MISSRPTKTPEEASSFQISQTETQQTTVSSRKLGFQSLVWICLLLACLGASLFSYQLFIVPQPASFPPSWGNAQWVKAADSAGPVAYFRHSLNINAPPNSAFVVIAANQVFSLYVNGKFIGSNKRDFYQGTFPRAYVYDVTSVVQTGTNVIAARVANVDNALPALRASFGMVRGDAVYRDGSGIGWLGTGDSGLVYQRYPTDTSLWTNINYNATSWRAVQDNTDLNLNPTSEVNPLLYEHPLSQQWIGVGVSHDAYFVRQFSLPLSYNGAWLRLAATGRADVYINGNQFISWKGQAPLTNPLIGQDLATYLSDTGVPDQPRAGLAIGIYNISPYLHAGINTIAVHVAAPGVNTGHSGQTALSSSLSTDALLSDNSGKNYWLSTDSYWRVSSKPVDGWLQGGSVVRGWSAPTVVARPGDIGSFYLPESLTQSNAQVVPIAFSSAVIVGASVLIIGLWLFFSLFVLRRFTRSAVEALAIGSLMYLPALALEGLLLALSREPQMPRPFPFTWFWVTILSAVVWVTCLILWLNTAARSNQKVPGATESLFFSRFAFVQEGLHDLYTTASIRIPTSQSDRIDRVLRWLRQNWALVALVLIAIPLCCYNLAYEPYWQDELSSYYASRGILASGLPFFPSGFLYPKSELYSYLLALWTTLFGQADGIPRAISVVEYLISLPLIYIVGSYFFNKRIALLATAMLTFSPTSLVWSRQMRMYEQEQMLTLLSVFLFYVALQRRNKTYLVYAAAISLVLTYFSHEEVFIALPGFLLAILVASFDKKRLLPAVFFKKHWWFAAIFCVVIIGLQLLVVKYSHPPTLGTDSSQRPQVGFTTDNIPFYLNLFFIPSGLGNGTYPFITLNSILATLGCFWALRSQDTRAKYCAVFLIVSVLTIVFVFTATADRYVYAILPVYYLMGSYALMRMLLVVWSLARPHMVLQRKEEGYDDNIPVTKGGQYLSWPMKLALRVTVLMACVSVLVLPILPLSGYNLFVSRLVGFAYHRHYADYDATGAYMKAHLQKDDIVISVAPPNTTLYYEGRVDYFFSVNRALFLIEKNGSIVETASNAHAMFNQDDFQTVLASHSRIWIISDNGAYQAEIFKRFSFPQDFHLVYEGYGSAVYFRGAK
jgi:4-amino-4-deoxy-L-arabinose transferase-like glycosyltransferase